MVIAEVEMMFDVSTFNTVLLRVYSAKKKQECSIKEF